MKLAHPLAILIVAAWPSVACAHGFAIYVSTPVTPPASYEWVRIVSLLTITGSVTLCHWKIAQHTFLKSVLTALATTVAFWFVFVSIGYFAASTTTAPPPGLGRPSAIYWRWGDGMLSTLFTFWNAIGMGVLVTSSLLVGGAWNLTIRGRIALVAIPSIAYLLLLSPFLATGAIAHGWAGGYIMNAGEDQLYDINRACFLYAKENGGRFPVARDFEEVMPQIEEHLKQRKSPYGNPIIVHPAAWAFKQSPKPFTWNTAMSGRPAPDLPVRDPAQMPVKCPYIGDRVRPIHDLDEDQ